MKLKENKWIKTVITAVFLVVLIIVFNSITDGIFSSPRNLTLLLKQGSVLMIVASGMMFLLIEKNFDLSGGASVYFTSVFLSMMLVNEKMNPILAVFLTIIVGLILGAINGTFVGLVGVPAFIGTLATQLIFKGIGYTWTDAATIGPIPDSVAYLSEGYVSPLISTILVLGIGILGTLMIFNDYKKMKKWESDKATVIKKVVVVWIIVATFSWVFNAYKGIPVGVVIAGAIAALAAFIANKTILGRHIYIIGGNTDAAKLSGINTKKTVFKSYLFMGLIYAVAGIVLTARLGGATATSGNLLELDAVAAASIGGVSMTGGTGSIPGVLLGVIILSSIDNVMSLMNVSSYLQMVVKGVILLISVTVDIYMNRKKFKLVKKGEK